MRLILPLLCLVLAIPSFACQTRVSRTQVPAEAVPMASALPTRAFELVERGRVVGIVVEFVELRGDRRFFSVRNELQQELGLVDQDGRFWRYRAHGEEDAEWIGSGTVLLGAIRILEADEGCEMFEVGLELLSTPASGDTD